MRVVINNTDDFIQRLDMVCRVCAKHPTLPVLQCVLLKVCAGKIIMQATNLEIGIEVIVETVGESDDGVVAVPAQVFLQTLQFVKYKEVCLELNNKGLDVKTSTSSTHINTISHEEFPFIPKIEKSPQSIQREAFSSGIKTTAFAASQSSIKPELGSVYMFQKKEHTITMVATDSFRLMEKTVSQKNFNLPDSVLIPFKNAIEFSRICDLMDTDPVFMIDDNQCALSFSDKVYITSRLVNGSFPDYEQIIPKEYLIHATVLRKDLMNCFKKTNIFLNKFSQVNMSVEENKIIISANNNDLGSTKEEIPAQVEGGDISLNFNQRYLTEPLSYIVDESVVLQFAGIGRSLVVTGVHDKSLRYLVMPMNR